MATPISTANISKTVTDRAKVTIAMKHKAAHVGFRLVHLTSAYSRGQLVRWNGVSSNIFAFMFRSKLNANEI